MRTLLLAPVVFLTVLFLAAGPPSEPPKPDRISLSSGWRLQSSVLAAEGGEAISTPGFTPEKWWPVTVPSTVLSALVKSGVYPDLRIGLNAYRIPDSHDEFNREHDLARFSHLPGRRNPWRDPWWYRTEFSLASMPAGQRLWLHFDAINYRADVWLNGRPIAEAKDMAGMFQRFQFDITSTAHAGVNALAVRVHPVDHPGLPQTQVEPLGPDRQYQSDLMRDVTMVTCIGYDCMMTVPDRNMGLWQPVWLEWTGPVEIRHLFVVTDLPLPETNRATLAISAELVNATARPVKGTLHGAVAGGGVRFVQRVDLAPNETRLVAADPRPVMENPRLWWPVNYGGQHLYDLHLWFVADGVDSDVGILSDEEHVRFGVREVGYELHEVNGYFGRRVLINGQKILCRGGYIQPELLFDWDAGRMETEIRYFARANLNLIYFEDIPNPPEPFLELCDRYGVLFGNVFYSCFWLRPGTPYPEDFPLLERCTVDLVKRYRNHPSLILYMAMNEEDTQEPVYEMWRRHLLSLDGTRWFIPSAYFPSDRKNVGEWFKKDLPTGMTDKGASYSWAEPVQYFNWVREARNWMFMMESGAASVPPMSSLARFLPEVRQPTPAPRSALYPLDADWAHHGANQYYQGFDAALRRLHGEPESVADYVWKAHLVTADQHRSMYEAVNHRMWDITSGFTEWKINACEPSIQWQIFDWFHKPMVSWFYIRKACEPLHVQLNLPDRKVTVINTRLAPQPGLQVRARIFDLKARQLWEKTAALDAPANAYRECFEVPELPTASPVSFVRLELQHASGRVVSENFYWLRSPGTGDLKALQGLPPVKLETAWRVETHRLEKLARVKVTNPTSRLAFFVQLALTNGKGGAEILPVLWDDNYFSLLPGESREIGARFAAKEDVGHPQPALEVGGWNIEDNFDCVSLKASTPEPRLYEPLTVAATIRKTFLDGSRVTLRVDGEPAAAQWAWARGEASGEVAFSYTPTRPGQRVLEVGRRNLEIHVRP